MNSAKTILVIGTYDTKDDELGFLTGVIRDQGGQVVTMDVSVLHNLDSKHSLKPSRVSIVAESSFKTLP